MGDVKPHVIMRCANNLYAIIHHMYPKARDDLIGIVQNIVPDFSGQNTIHKKMNLTKSVTDAFIKKAIEKKFKNTKLVDVKTKQKGEFRKANTHNPTTKREMINLLINCGIENPKQVSIPKT